jgi:transcriptional regulator with XRE-family HTH domain
MAGRRMHAEFAARLRLALDEAGYRDSTLRELATLFKVTPQALRKWLDGEARPVSGRAALVAGVLGVRRAWLFDNELPMRAINTDMAELPNGYEAADDAFSISRDEFLLLDHFRSLPKPAQQAVMNLVLQMAPDAAAPAARRRRRGSDGKDKP